MKGNFSDVKEAVPAKFADSSLGKQACEMLKKIGAAVMDISVVFIEENMKNCPLEHGEWSKDRGNSKWKPEKDYVPQKSNPEGKSWEKILKEYGIDGIYFRNGQADFRPISKGNVEIKDFSTERTDNFTKADIELAKKKGCSPEAVKQWRKANKYTWHECMDKKTMQKVPSIVHNNVSHRGGISKAKEGV